MIVHLILWSLLGLNGFHPFHVSVCDVDLDAESKALEITHHIFLDDLEIALRKRFDPKLDIINPQNSEDRDEWVKTYLMGHFTIYVNGKEMEGNYLGHEIEQDAIYCYIEVGGIRKLEAITVKNTLLTDLFDDQINLVHIKVDGKIRSLKLDKKNASGQIEY